MISENALAQIIQHNAKTLCSKQGNKMLNEYAGKGQISNDMNPDDYTDEWDNWNFDDPNNSSQPRSAAPSMNYNESSAAKSALPDAIKKSMLEHQIATPSQGSTAFLDNLGNGMQKQTRQPQRQMVTEQVVAPQMQGANLDYNYLKYLIKECLNEYFKENNVLNESSNGTLTKIGLSNGKIKLVDNKGNIFSADLQHQGNIKDKKK